MTVSSTTPVVTYPKSASDVGGATDEMHILYMRDERMGQRDLNGVLRTDYGAL